MKDKKTGGFPVGTVLHGIRSLAGLKDRCVIDEHSECWIWSMSKSSTGAARASVMMPWNPKPRNMQGIRAAYEYNQNKPLEAGLRVWSGCGNPACCNPRHATAGTVAEWGKFQAERGLWKGRPERVKANRQNGNKRKALTDEQVRIIRESNETGSKLAEVFGVTHQTISAVRLNKRYADQAVMRGASIFRIAA